MICAQLANKQTYLLQCFEPGVLLQGKWLIVKGVATATGKMHGV